MTKGKKRAGSRVARVVRQRAAAERRAAALEGMPGDVARVLASPDALPEWKRFLRAYPTVPEAVAAVRAGEVVEVHSEEYVSLVRRVLVAEAGAFVETTLHPPYGTVAAIATGLFNSDDRAAAVRGVLAAMPELLPGDLRVEGLECVVEEDGDSPLPVFAYRYRVAAEGLGSWGEHEVAASRFAGLADALGWADRRIAVGARAVEVLRGHGVAAVSCAACGEPVTDRHPVWPGVWVDLLEESGPVCPEHDGAAGRDGGHPVLDLIDIGGPHRVDGAGGAR
ncbi:hypothetical protein ABT160_12100 [Streptomyces sp. NPDC001941]|uniref:hypothetical protein n=1 Tax=Streptomyces sp. NPDC001941 TaxID=3154659 RepID=UPI003317A85E